MGKKEQETGSVILTEVRGPGGQKMLRVEMPKGELKITQKDVVLLQGVFLAFLRRVP